MHCRHCGASVENIFIDLGSMPPANAYLEEAALASAEKYYPLQVRVCDKCWLVQTVDYADAEEFFERDYAYFSSASSSWIAHAKDYFEKARRRFQLNSESFVLEIASNDGYLLQNFVRAGIPCLGVEPTSSTASAAAKLGVPVHQDFFSEKLAVELSEQGKQADLIVGNNVLAHVPNINDFTRGLKVILKKGGAITIEFQHLLRLIDGSQFDTIYHEHFSYLSFFTVNQILESSGLRVWDVEELSTHGGSLRVFACHTGDSRDISLNVNRLLAKERDWGVQALKSYAKFQPTAEKIKEDLLRCLTEIKVAGKSVVAYGAAAKGNTLLNYAGVTKELLPAVYDTAASKYGKYLPGSRIPILPQEQLLLDKPDFVLVLPWNIAEEICNQHSELIKSGTKFFSAVPELQFYEI